MYQDKHVICEARRVGVVHPRCASLTLGTESLEHTYVDHLGCELMRNIGEYLDG
jgi:hypothetical protein